MHVSRQSSAGRQIERIQEYVLANLQNEALGPRSVARLHGISPRQLHRLFRSSGLTLCRWIRQCRLDRCASDLRDHAQVHRSITEIAFCWGFNDAAHFSRLFRAAFDASPTDYRASVLANAPRTRRLPLRISRIDVSRIASTAGCSRR